MDGIEFSEDFVSEHGLSEDQVKAISGHLEKEIIPTAKQSWAKETNGALEAMLDSASKYAIEKTGVDVKREHGEKWGDFLNRLSDKSFESQKSALEKKSTELEEKLKNFKGGDELKTQLEQEQEKNNELLKQVAELDKLKGLDKKYEEATGQLSSLKREVAYNSVKPNFPDTVNQYEADAKWNAFKSGIEEKYNIEIVDNKPIAIDKENEHRRFDLKELVEGDETLKKLSEGRQQKGTGSDPAEQLEVDGVPFKVKKGATSEELSNQVNEYLVKKLGSSTHDDYAPQFAEIYGKVKKAAAA